MRQRVGNLQRIKRALVRSRRSSAALRPTYKVVSDPLDFVHVALALGESVELLRSCQNASTRINSEYDDVFVVLFQSPRQARDGSAGPGTGDEEVDLVRGGEGGWGGEGINDLRCGSVVVCVGVCGVQFRSVSD